MCQGLKLSGGRCRRKAEPFCWQHQPVFHYGPNRAAFEDLLAGRSGVPAHVSTLAAMLADELDRQVTEGEGLNAALVGRYVEVLEVLAVDDDRVDAADEVFTLRSKILHPPEVGAA